MIAATTMKMISEVSKSADANKSEEFMLGIDHNTTHLIRIRKMV